MTTCSLYPVSDPTLMTFFYKFLHVFIILFSLADTGIQTISFPIFKQLTCLGSEFSFTCSEMCFLQATKDESFLKTTFHLSQLNPLGQLVSLKKDIFLLFISFSTWSKSWMALWPTYLYNEVLCIHVVCPFSELT